MVLLLLAGSIVVFAVIRRWRWRVLDRELRTEIKVGDEVSKSFNSLIKQVGDVDAVAAGVVTAYDMFHALAMIDDSVLEAMDFSSKLDLDTFNEISRYVHDHFLSGAEASIAGAMERLEGYTAERIVAAHLAAQGHIVEFADIPNQEGWDILVDGHPVQVKCVMDPDLIREHLDKFHDIPVIVNAEMAHYFDGNDNVIVDHDLHHDEVARHVKDTIHGVDRLGDGGIHIPLVTLALAAIREGNLLLNGRISVGEAAVNVMRDTIAVGGGGYIGSKIGVALGGAVLGPFGAAVGAVLGAFFGAKAGRGLARRMRMAAFEEAKREFNEAVFKVVSVVPDAINERIKAIDRKAERARRKLKISFWNWLWPTRRRLLYEEIRRRAEEMRKNLLSEIERAKQVMEKYYRREGWENGFYKPGMEYCMWLSKNPFNYPPLIAAMKRANECAEKLKAEAYKLGLDMKENTLGKAILNAAVNAVVKVSSFIERIFSGRGAQPAIEVKEVTPQLPGPRRFSFDKSRTPGAG